MTALGTVAVLTYHSIGAQTTGPLAHLTVDPAMFDEHLAALREHDLDVIPFREVPSALVAGARAVTITIDDGFADAAENACPALAAYGLPATLFIPTAYVGATSGWLPGDDAWRPMCSWREIAEIARAGFEIGSHGHLHLAADINSTTLVQHDAWASRVELEEHLGQAVTSFAYPFGYHAGPARAAVRAAGFAQACAVADLPAHARADRWALPRLQVRSDTSPEALLELVGRRATRPARGWAYSKQTIWRAGRRWAGWGPIEAGRVPGGVR
ncbi:MAG TPA: polysaccharide deacetylase family protein [Solirubrobacteraceae bacterium]|nr:polysaccharide deacetylase family protein [Solirubrobacteraceae bacterium]